MKRLMQFAFAATALALTVAAMPAQTVSLFLKSNGQLVQGESTVTSMGRENSIECLYFKDAVLSVQSGSGPATGRRTYEPIVFRKRIDKSSPLLARALCNNEVIEGTFRFYRPNPAGDGTTQHFFTVEIREGRVASIRRISPDVLDPASAAEPPTEEVTLVFQNITWTYVPGGITHSDTFRSTATPTRLTAPTRPTIRPPLETVQIVARNMIGALMF